MRTLMWLVLFFLFVLCVGERFVHEMGPISEPEYGNITSWTNKKYPLFDRFNGLPPKYKLIFERQKNRVVEMFQHAFSGYLKHALYYDELKSTSCTGSNDLGGFSASLLEGISTLLLFDPEIPNTRENLFKSLTLLLQRIEDPVKFVDRDVTVSVFETIIRIIGPLLSIHQTMNGDVLSYYSESLMSEDEIAKLIDAASKLADRLMPAFNTNSNIPYPEIDIKRGIIAQGEKDTLVSAAGTSLLEFAVLSEITKNNRYKGAAETSAVTLYHSRNPETELLGTRLSIKTGEWLDPRASIGGNADSFLEYMVKYPIYLKQMNPKTAKRWENRISRLFKALKRYSNFDRYWVDVHMATGKVIYPYFYSLSAFWPSVLVLRGEVSDAEKNFAAIMSIWETYGGVPEIQNVMHGDSLPLRGYEQYFLRPEVAESAFYLYMATKNPRYKYAGYLMLEAIENTMKTECGYCILESVVTKEKGDKMPSYFLGETLKYLYLLFDEDHPLLKDGTFFQNYVFSTEGQIFAVPKPEQTKFYHPEL